MNPRTEPTRTRGESRATIPQEAAGAQETVSALASDERSCGVPNSLADRLNVAALTFLTPDPDLGRVEQVLTELTRGATIVDGSIQVSDDAVVAFLRFLVASWWYFQLLAYLVEESDEFFETQRRFIAY